MAIQVQLRRGTAAQNNAFTGAIGELSFDTTNNQLRVHDGSTAGGFKIGVGNFPTGTNNVVLGNTALDSLDGSSPGGNNTAVGHDALTANTTASNNVAVGKDALKANTTAASSTAVGTSALAANTGTLNTALGKDAGSLITSGTKNTIVGSFDGNQGGLDIRTSNSHIVLSDGDGNPRLIIDNNGNVDIGDETTELKLKNTTHEDTDGGRESKISFQGEQSGGEQSILAQIQASHDGASDDEKGNLVFRTNDGSDGTSPTEAARIDSKSNFLIGHSDNTDVAGHEAGLQIVGQGTADYHGSTISIIGNANNTNGAYLNFAKTRSNTAGSFTAASNGDVVGEINFSAADGTDLANRIAYIQAKVNDNVASNDTAGRFEFATTAQGSGTPAVRLRIDDDGLKFNNDTAADNALNDYEQGTFNLTMGGGSSNPSATQNLASEYVKIGKHVSFRSFGTLNNTGASGTIYFTGLPFTPTGVCICSIECNSQGTFSLSPYGYISGTVIYIQQMRSNNTYAAVNHNVASSGEWSITGHFFTNS